MEGFEASNENNNEVTILAEQFAKEKNDIVCGFLKEKEIIEMIHKEEVNDLVAKYEQEKECLRREFESEQENLLQGFQTQQVEKLNEYQRERENVEIKTAKDFQSRERNVEMKYKEERRKMRREYEEIIAGKNEEIKMLRRELLRAEHQENKLPRQSPDNDIYITRTEHDEELRRLAEKFGTEKSELERQFDREKAKLVQVFSNQTERMNANFDHVKQRMQEDQEKELEFKVEITEKLLSEKSDLDRKRMLQQFEREITELQESFEMSFDEKLHDKQQTIDDLEKEKKELLNVLHTERFSLARVYNREISLLTKPDQLTNEDVEVALIDETAKLKQQYENALTEMEEQHKKKIEVVKRNQKPLRELELQHRKDIEKLKKDFANEKERLEAEFRKEQFNLLKSFEFERNDLEQRYEEFINERELEIQQREDDMRRLYEEELDDLKAIVAKQREELEISKQKLTDLADQTEEFLSERNRMEETFLKENNKCQNLQQTMEKNVKTYEKNTKEVEAFWQNELTKKTEELAKEKDQLQKITTEKLDLQKEIEALKEKLEEFHMASENALEANSEAVLESCLVENNADEESKRMTGDDESKPIGTKRLLDEKKEEEDEKERQTQTNENEQVNECLRKIKERLRRCISEEEEQPTTLEEFQMSNKHIKDAINLEIVEIDKICGGSKENDENDISLGEDPTFSLEDQLQAVENILTEGDTDGRIDKTTKDKINEKMKGVLKKAHRLHEFEKLKLKEEQQEEISKLLKELADEKRLKVQESVENLKHLQDQDKRGDRSPRCVESKATEDKGTSTDNRGHTKEEKNARSRLYTVDELRREKEEMKRSIDELEKSFNKEKEVLMEKLQTQHKEFVTSAEGEIIENLLNQKSTLEEAFNLERFYLSRLYYLEMKEELEDILSRKKEKLKREFNRDKVDITLKYESDIADLHKLLSERGEMEIKLLQDRNDVTRKLLATHKKGTPEKGKRKQMKEKERLEREKENLEVAIPLKKEIAELQSKRHQEHETAVANLKEATDLIKDIMTNTPSIAPGDDQQFDRLSFLSEDPMRSTVASPAEKSSESRLKPRKRVLLSDDEIRNKDELKNALENFVDMVLNEDEESVYDSDTTSGASSDLESDDSGPTTVNGESDEGAYSGPESTDGDMLNIKKAQLDFAFNLERFNLGRVYYGEYRDSLRKAMKKLGKAKETLRSKRKDLESEMLDGIKALVKRTHFGEEYTQASKRDIETQTAGEAASVQDGTEDLLDGQQLINMKKADNAIESLGKVDGGPIDSQDDLESDQEEKKKGKIEDKKKRLEETPAQSPESSTGDHSPNNEKLTDDNKTQEKVNAEKHSSEGEHDIKNSPVTSESKLQSDSGKDNVRHAPGQDLGKIKDESSRNLDDKNDDDIQTEHDSKTFPVTSESERPGRGKDGVCHAVGQDRRKNEEAEEEEEGESSTNDDRHTEHESKTPPVSSENEPQPEIVKDDVCVSTIEEKEEETEAEEESRKLEDKNSREGENNVAPLNGIKTEELQSSSEEMKRLHAGIKEEEQDIHRPTADHTKKEKKDISEYNIGKDTTNDMSKETEDLEDRETIDVGDRISSEDRTQEEPKKDKKECVKDELSDEKVDKDTKERILEKTDDAGEIEVIKVDNRMSIEDKAQEEPNTEQERYKKVPINDYNGVNDTKEVSSEEIEDVDESPQMSDRISLREKTEEESTQAKPSEDEKKIERDVVDDKPKGKKKRMKGKERKADKVTKEESPEEIEDVDDIPKVEEESTEAKTSEDEKQVEGDIVDDKPKRKKTRKKGKKRKTDKYPEEIEDVDDITKVEEESTEANTSEDEKQVEGDIVDDKPKGKKKRKKRKDRKEKTCLAHKEPKVPKSLKDEKEEEEEEVEDEDDEEEEETKEHQKGDKGVTKAEFELEPQYDSTPIDGNESPMENKVLERKDNDEDSDKSHNENVSDHEDIEGVTENARFSEKSDDYFQTEDEEKEDSSIRRSVSPISDQDLIKKLNINNKILQDKFNLLRELVGKGFVNEIPELSDGKKREGPVAALEKLSDLYAEKEQLANEFQKIDSQMKELSESGSDNIRDLNKQLEDKESEILHSLELIDKQLKTNNDKELVEHLLKEKEDVCTKLDEINDLLNEKKEEMADLWSSDAQTVPGLMFVTDVLKDDLIEKARERNYKSKMVEETSKAWAKDKENLENYVNSLKVQLAALEDSIDNANDNYPFIARQMSKTLPSEIASLLSSKADTEHKKGKLEKEMKKTENDIGRYQRILEEQNNRLKPFERKKARLEETLKWVNQAENEPDELTSRKGENAIYDVEDPMNKSEIGALMTGNRTNVPDEDSTITKGQQEIENQIEELDVAISNTELPCNLGQKLTDDTTTAEKLGIVHQAKISKEADLKLLEAEIVEEQNKLRKAGFDDLIQLTEHLEENERLKNKINKLDNSQLDMAGFKTEEQYPEVNKLHRLLLLQESVEGKVHKLDGEICEEQVNFLEARQFKRSGKMNPKAESKIKELIDTKEKLETDLKNTNETILQSLSTGGLTGPQAEFIEECVERKVKLEEEIDKLQNQIDTETVRAANMLEDLLERKFNANKELEKTTGNANDEVKRMQVHFCNDVEHSDDIPEEINEIISKALLILGQKSVMIPERDELRQKQNEIEDVLKEKAERLTEAKRRGQETSEEEEALEFVIREKISVDKKLQEVLGDEKDGRTETVSLPKDTKKKEEKLTDGGKRVPGEDENILEEVLGEHTQNILEGEDSERTVTIHAKQKSDCGNFNEDLDDKRKELEENLCLNEKRLFTLLQNAGLSDDLEKNDFKKLKFLAFENVKLEEELEESQLLEDLLSKKQTLQGQLCDEAKHDYNCERKVQLERELEKLNSSVKRRENELLKIQTKKNAKEEIAKQLSDEKEKLDERLNPLMNNIIEAKEEVEGNLKEAQTNLNENEKCAIEEQQALRQELGVLQDDINHCNKEEEELEKELYRLKKEFRQTNGNVLDLEKLLIEKDSLREYLVEIDATLDNSETDIIEQDTIGKVEELTEQKEGFEMKLEEIRNEKAKIDVDFEEEEMDEAMKELAQMKKDLEAREREVTDQIRDSGVLGKLAAKRKKRKSEMPRYVIQGILDAMARDEKTLSELLKEQDELKNAAQKQRDDLDETITLVKTKVGEDLVNSLTSSVEETQPQKESQHRSAVDQIEGKEVTISDILDDLGEENKQLRGINDELCSDLEMLKEKIGEELVNEILIPSAPIKQAEFGDVVSAIQDDEKTVEMILHEQKDKLHIIEEELGKGLFTSILRKEDKPDTKGDADSASKLVAPVIMRQFDEDLENVISVYEKELDNLSHENNALKEKLGEDLSKELLKLSKSTGKPGEMDEIQLQTPPKIQDEEAQDETWFEGSEPTAYVENKGISLKVQEGRPLSSQEAGVDTDQTDDKMTDSTESQHVSKSGTSELKDPNDDKLERSSRPEGQRDALPTKDQQTEDEDHNEGIDTLPIEAEINIAPRLYNICSLYFSSPQENSLPGLTDEVDENVKISLNAPKIMQDNGNTLGEIIAQYERDLHQSTSSMINSPTRPTDSDKKRRLDGSDSANLDDITEVDMTMQGIAEAQQKNMEMLRILKERLGEDLVDALINETEEDHFDDMLADGKNDDRELPDNEGDTQDDNERHLEETTVTEPGEDEPEESLYSSNEVVPSKMPNALESNTRKIRAPNIALENKKTLGDVIASYENVLDSLQSKLGPSLTRILLAMEDPAVLEHEDKRNQETTKKVKEETSDKDDTQRHEEQPVGEVDVKDKELIESSQASPDPLSDQGENAIVKALRAPEIMATRKKTLEEVIEDYEERINEELKQIEKDVSHLKEKLGNDLFDTLLNQSSRDGAMHTKEVTSPAEEITDNSYPEATNPESVAGEGDVPADDLKAKSLLQDEGKTVEDILRSYEKQLQELSKLVPNENGESASILDLISNYEDKIADLERQNKTSADRLENLSQCIGLDLMHKLESIETQEESDNEDANDGVEEDGIKAPMVMKVEDKTLEKVVTNYEKELDALRKMLPGQGEAITPIADIIKDYEDKIDNLKNRSQCFKEEHDKLVSRIGHDLVDDILALKSLEDKSRDESIDLSDIKLETKPGINKSDDSNGLNATIIMDKEDSTLETVLEIYEKALGILPRPQVQDDSFVDNKLHTFDDLKRENKILKDALGDKLATSLITNVDENAPQICHLPEASEASKKNEMELLSQGKDHFESAKPSHPEQRKRDIPDSEDKTHQLNALELVTDEGETIENILKNYEKELEALRKLVPSETTEGASVSELVKDYEDRIEDLENKNKTRSEMFRNLAENIGPGLMDELQNLHTKEHEGKHLNDNTTSDLEAINVMENENRTLEGVVRIYENELDALRKLVPDQVEEASSISDIVKDYEDKLKEIAEENENVKDELLGIQGKIGQGLVDDLNKLEGIEVRRRESSNEASEKVDRDAMKDKIKLKAPDIMNETKLPLEEILAVYEGDLCNLKRENKMYQEGLGQSMAEALLELAEEKEGSYPGGLTNQESNTQVLDGKDSEPPSKLNERMENKAMEHAKSTIGTKTETRGQLEKPSQKDAIDKATGDTNSGTDELKAMDLLREDGNDLAKILKSYEKEIEALKKIAPGETEEGISVSDLIKDYEDKIRDLESNNATSEEKLNNLEKHIGQELFCALENLQSEEKEQNGDDYPSDKEIDLNAVNVMTNEDRTLENVVKNYEKELSAMRKLLPGREDETSSLSDIIKEYEDKIEELQRENEDLRNDFEVLEDKIGRNLLDNLKTVCRNKGDEGTASYDVGSEGNSNKSEILRAPEIMNENDLTLENVIASYVKNLDNLAKENKVLKDGLGPRLVNLLLNIADKKEGSALPDYNDQNKIDDVGNDLTPLQLPREERTRIEESEKQQVVVDRVKDPTETISQPLDRNNNDEKEISTPVAPCDLKAAALIAYEGRTIENILKNYEKQLEALKQLAPGNEETSISDLVTEYEDAIEGLEKENDNLVSRLENLEKKIGTKLLNDMEHRAPEGATAFQGNPDHKDDDRLMAPRIMEKEERTLGNVVKTYEKELDVLRNLISSEGEEGSTLTDLVKTYEDKIDHLKTENVSLKDDSERLQNRIGYDLVNDINKLEEITADVTEGEELETSKPVKDLKVTKIMDVKKSTLEDVLETYESALGMLLSDESTSIDELTSDNIDEQSSTLKELKQENDILKNTVGLALSQKLINIATSEADSNSCNTKDAAHVSEQDTDTDDELASIKGLAKTLKHPTLAQDDNQKDSLSDGRSSQEGLKAENLVKEEGRTIENILKNYEKELETLKSLVLNGSGQPADTFSDLVRKYEDEKDELEKKLQSLEDRIDFLEGKIGSDLMNDLESKQNSEETLEGTRRSEVNAPIIMEEEDRTLETVIKSYEKELDALRKIALSQQEDGEVSISDIIKDYEDKLDELKNETKSLKNNLDKLQDRLGSNLVKDIKRLDDETVDGDDSSDVNKNKVKDTGVRKQLKAPKIMLEEGSTLEDILKRYEDTLDLNFSNIGLPHEDADREKASGDSLETINDIKKENEIFKNALGENLTQSILEAAMDNKSKDDHLEQDTSMQTANGIHRGDLHKGVQENKPSLTTGSQDRSPYGDSLKQRSESSPSDGLKANALMRDEGRTVENILKNYEKEIEALSKLLPQETDPGVSISDLVTSYEDKIEDLKAENSGLEKRLEILTGKIGKDLAKDLESGKVQKEGDGDLSQLKEGSLGRTPKWKAVEKIKEDETTLADILEIYERDLERLEREKSAMEVLVNDNEGDGQSALDIISQYEDEIEHLKDTNKELESKLSLLFARVGDTLANDILSMTPDKETDPSCSLQAVQIMEMQEKQLSAVLEQYEDDIRKLTRENEALKVIASEENVDGKPLTSLVSDYEIKIEELLKDKRETESRLRILKEKIGGSLANEMLNPDKEGEAFPLNALNIMENERKSLADVIQEYEDDLAKITREISTLRDLVSEDPETKSFMEKISKYEDEISNLAKKMKEQSVLEKKVGIDLSKQLTALGERGREESQSDVTLKAIEVMEENKDTTLADILKGYEEDLEKNNHEILTLKELISGDMLEIAASQESEIDELKKVKAILAGELDVISDKVGKELVDELLKRSTQKPTTESGKLYQEVVQRMENERKPLQSIIEEYDKETKHVVGRNEELSKKEDVLTEKIGNDLVNELLRTDAYESTRLEAKPLFEAPELMSTEKKTLGEVVLNYEKELAKLKRENGALRLLTEKESPKDTSVIDVLSDYEEQIEKLEAENRELSKRLQKVTQRVGVELIEELLKLPDEVCKSTTETINELNALRILKENQTTLTDVLQNYEKKLREDDEADFGPLVSGKATKEDIKFAQLVRVDASEPEITISKEEPSDISRYLEEFALDKTMTPDAKAVDLNEQIETTPLDSQDQLKNLADTNAKLRKKLEQLSRKVGKELSEELIKSPEDKDNEMRTAVKFASVRDLDAFDDIDSERTTLAQVLESYQKKLKGALQDDIGTLVKGHIIEEEIKPIQLERANECVEEICYIGETEILSHYKVPENDLDRSKEEEVDGHTVPELSDLDLSLDNLILEKPQIMAHPNESLLSHPDRETIKEDIIKVEEYRACIDSEFVEYVFATDTPLAEKGGQSQEPDSQFKEIKAESREREEMETLEKKVKQLEKELKEEKLLKEKYEKDVQDLLGDIVGLKMKQVENDSEGPDETRRKIQEEVDLKQDNKRLQEDLTNERKRKLSLEKSERDLLDKVNTLMKEKEMLFKQQNEPQLEGANECVEEICDIGETEILSHYKVPENDLARNEEEEVDGCTFPQLSDLDRMSLDNFILETPQIMAHSNESLLSGPDRESIKEENVELSNHEECFNYEFVDNRFASDIPLSEKGDLSKGPDSQSTEKVETLEKKIKELEKELEEEKLLKEKYEKDVQDLLKDIVDLKMKQVDDDAESPEDTRRTIQEEIVLKQDNKRLYEDLTKERKRRRSIEESKRDLLDEVDTLMRENENLLKQHNESKGDEKLLEDMINLRKKIGELDTKNKNLNREVKELKESITELEACNNKEKSQLLASCENEKSEMREEQVTSKRELETQLQELLGMNDDLKGTIKNLLEELKESNERLVTEGDSQNETESEQAEKEKGLGDEARARLTEDTQEKERNAAYEREKNENLKEQLDETENALKQTLKKYQEEITAIETEKAKREDELRQEIEILSNKLDLEKASAEQQRKDFENIVQREKERLKEDMAIELERERKKLKLDYEDREDELTRQGKRRSTELQEQEEQWNKEREEMQEIFRIEKEKLQKAFDEELQSKIAEKDEEHRQRNEDMKLEFLKEKKEMKTTIEKKIYEHLIDKNIEVETDFQEVLSKILQEHSREIDGVEDDIRKAEDRFIEDKNKLIEQSDKEKEALKKTHEEEKKALELTVQNLLKEVVKLKHQRKEIRIIHKKEKESMEEMYERDRVKLKEDWEQYKRDLLSKFQDEFDNKLANETTQFETRLEDVKRELENSEQRRKELEERLRGIPRESEQQRFDKEATINKTEIDKEEHLKELKYAKKNFEDEYEKKLKEEKRKFEETLQGLRREIGSLQEKRRFIQDKLYNQDPSVMDRHLMEKSLANYKMEMLSKMEEEVAQKIAREKKPLEETIKEMQLEIDDLKRQRWELRNQLRRERSKLEEEFELERENMENQFLKGKEELKNKIETRIQREMAKRAMEDKVSRALSPTSNESPYSPQDSPRRLRSENTTLRDDKYRLELEVRQLSSKLETLEINFQEIMSSEKIKLTVFPVKKDLYCPRENEAEKMKKIQAKMPKKVSFSDDVETRTMGYTTGDHNETILHELRERDHQVTQLLEAKHFYEEVLSELCEEAGLFELDQNVVI